MKHTSNNNLETVTFGEGCFWCVEPLYARLKGVDDIIVGFTGGTTEKPSYEEVCTGTTEHTEVAQINYDPSIISFNELLKVFWETHDPTVLNQQGADIGTQYRSVIFYHNEAQKDSAEDYKNRLNLSGAFNKPIVTAIEPLKSFYPAEGYQQNYFDRNPHQPYCQIVVKPKVEKFEKTFKAMLK